MAKTECMMHQCNQCPDHSELRAFWCELLQGFDDISSKQWETTDRCILATHSALVEEHGVTKTFLEVGILKELGKF